MRTESEATLGSAGLIAASALGGALAGFFLQLLVAFYFGSGQDTDAFFMAQSAQELVSKLLMGGSITSVFLPMFVKYLTRGQKHEAWTLGLNIFHLTSIAFLILILTIGIFADPFINFIAPGFDQATTAQTIILLRVLLPSFLFLFLADLATAMLHSVKHFLVPALLRIIAPLTSIVVLVLTIDTLGISSLAYGALIGSLFQFIMVGYTLRRNGFQYHFVLRPFDPKIRRLAMLVYPFIYSVAVTQAAGIVYRILVSDLSAGSLSSLKFAEKISQLVTIMFLTSVTTVVYPLLSEKAGHRDYRGMRTTISNAMRLITFVTVPVIICIALLRNPLISLLYERGSFSALDSAQTSIALLFFVIGLTINGISAVLGYATLALQETRASAAVTISSQAIAIFLFVLLVPTMGHAGLALGSSLVPLAIALLYFLYLSRFIDKLYMIFWHPVYLKTSLLAIALILVINLTRPLIHFYDLPRDLMLIIQVMVPALVGCTVYFGGAWLFDIKEINEAAALMRKKIRLLL